MYIYNGLDHDVGINKPTMQILKWLCHAPNRLTHVYGVAVLSNQDNDGNYVDFTVDEFMFLLAEVKRLERTHQVPPAEASRANCVRRIQDSTTQSCSASFFLMTAD